MLSLLMLSSVHVINSTPDTMQDDMSMQKKHHRHHCNHCHHPVGKAVNKTGEVAGDIAAAPGTIIEGVFGHSCSKKRKESQQSGRR